MAIGELTGEQLDDLSQAINALRGLDSDWGVRIDYANVRLGSGKRATVRWDGNDYRGRVTS